jgi:hypothetical protein
VRGRLQRGVQSIRLGRWLGGYILAGEWAEDKGGARMEGRWGVDKGALSGKIARVDIDGAIM